MENRKRNLNGNTLKLIAILAMTLDHIAWLLFPGYSREPIAVILHILGRITAPIMWFFIAEGYFYTRNKKKYAMRLLLFAGISHFAYNFFFEIPFIPFQTGFFNQTSVIWALFIAFLALNLTAVSDRKIPPLAKTLLFILLCFIAFPADWSCIAVLAIVWISDNRQNFKKQMLGMMICILVYALVYCLFLDFFYGLIQFGTVLSVPLLARYNGQKGNRKGMKWLFYLYYPLHLLVLGIVKNLLK